MTDTTLNIISSKVAAHKFKFRLKEKLKGSEISIQEIEKDENSVSFQITFNSVFINADNWNVTPMLSNIINKVFVDTRGSKTNTSLVWIDNKNFKIQLDI